MRIALISVLLFFLFGAQAQDFGRSNIKRLKWGDLEVVWLKDERFPTYSARFYFADGALSDKRGGVTSAMFDLIASGTRRFSQKDIAENLEFYGVSHGAQVFHENSIYYISGLVGQIVPTMKKVCHLFNDAAFPRRELVNYRRRFKNSLRSLQNSPAALADRAFRSLSLRFTPYNIPADGRLRDASAFTAKRLRGKLDYFNDKVKKRIYLHGPSGVLDIKPILQEECGWKGQGTFVRSTVSTRVPKAKVYLVTAPRANQAQVRIGRYLKKGEYDRRELLELLSNFLGGGFTSQLIKELRVKRGLVYSASAFAAGQKDYGRAAISTATKLSNVGNLIEVIKEILERVSTGEFDKQELEQIKRGLVGSYPFKFESGSDYLARLLFADHVGRSHSDIFKFQSMIKSYTKDDLVQVNREIFDWKKQFIVVLGPKSLKKQLDKFGKVRVVSYKDFL